MDRREFLELGRRVALGAAAAPLLAACHSGSTSPRPTTPPPSTPTVSPTGTVSPPTEADWAAFGRSLDGELVRPGEAGYAIAHQLFNPRFDRLRPAGIAYCQSTADVQRSVAFVHEHGIDVAPRSGGHSYGGYSSGSGLICDVTRLASVRVNAPAGVAVVGAGAHLVDVYAALAARGVAIPAGSCPTVGVGGLALGGGIGVIGRKFGLTCDTMASARIVTAGGDVLTCDASTNADLFWACRGGGGGNFGVVTSFTFRVHPLTSLTLFSSQWPWAAAADVLAGWQGWGPAAPDELWSACHLRSSTDKSPGVQPSVSVSGAYVGPSSGLIPLLAELRAAVGAAPTSTSVSGESYLNAMLIEAGCSGKTVAECHLPSQNAAGTYAREASRARSDFFDQPIGPAVADAAVAAIEQRQASPQMSTVGGIAFDASGGAINRVPSAATAFVHRSSLFTGQYVATWPEGSSSSVVTANVDWLNATYAALRPAASGFAYQNYIDPDLSDWQHAYYGDNFDRLVQVKATYDPDDVFRFAQSIPTS